LKIGESLLQIAKRCGKTLPKYESLLMDCFLQSCSKDPSPFVRASSLSNLAELCKQLHFALQPYLREILTCVTSILQSDSNEEVRRGAVFLISLLFRGLGLEIFELIPEDLRNLFHILKRLQESDADEITKTHATIALSELNSIVKAFLSPSAENRQRSFLEKQLYIINNDL